MDTAPSASPEFQAGYSSWSRRFHRELIWAYQGLPPTQRISVIVPHTIVWRIIEGEAVVRPRGSETCLSASAGQWIAPGNAFEQTFSPETRILSLHFHCEWITGCSIFPTGMQLVTKAGNHPDLDQSAFELVRQIPEKQRSDPTPISSADIDFNSFLQIDSTFSTWLSRWIATVNNQGISLTETSLVRPEIVHAAEYIRGLLPDKNYAEEEVARATGLSRSSLRVLFINSIGMTPLAYYHKLRMDRILTELEFDTTQIKEVAYRHGFNSVSQFSNWFRRRAGVSPSEFRAGQQPLT